MTTAPFARVAALLLGVGLLSSFAGCSESSPKTDVSGKIALNGKEPKLTGLQIAFQGTDGSIVTADIGEDGKYQAVGVPVGEVKVFFTAITQEQSEQSQQLKSRTPRLQKPKSADTGAPKAPPSSLPKAHPIPARLRDPGSSMLTVNVEVGTANTFDYNIPKE